VWLSWQTKKSGNGLNINLAGLFAEIELFYALLFRIGIRHAGRGDGGARVASAWPRAAPASATP
jgi:hypothetical protein